MLYESALHLLVFEYQLVIGKLDRGIKIKSLNDSFNQNLVN